MDSLKNLKIKNKLIAIILLVSTFMLTISFITIILIEKKTMMDTLRGEVTSAARLLHNNLVGALDFAPEDEIKDEMKYLEGVSTIKRGFLYNSEGQLVATFPESYGQNNKITPPDFELYKSRATATIESKSGYLDVYQVMLSPAKEYRGLLHFKASTEELDKRIQNFILLMVAFIFALMLLSVFLANKLQSIISSPILDLVKVTKDVSSEVNYSIRVQKKSNDEIGMLYDGFNQMMEQIHERDVQRTNAKNELRASQFFLSSVIDSMPILLITVEQNGRVTQWNKSAALLTGIPAHEAVGGNLWELLPEFHDFQQAVNSISNGKSSHEFYKKLLKIQQGAFYFNGSIFPLMETATPTYVIMLNDVTEIEQKEKQLRQSQKMETVGNLAGGLAHDFNNVLGGIIGTISLFKYKTAKKKGVSSDDVEKYFNTIEEAANRASDMVKHLLSLTRKQELTFSPTDLNATAESTVRICKNTFDKSIDIETHYFKNKAMSQADPTQIEQALLNLCINASHAMTIMRSEGDKFGGKLNITLKKTRVDKYFRQIHPEAEEDNYWDISISDTGIGMDQRTLSKIFDPFFTTKREGTGTGLGLAMVYNIIKQHRGFIDVYSQEDIGTTFHIYLPILEGTVHEAPAREEEQIPQGDGVILVVDDEEVMRQTAKSILMECGYDVLMAENGREALEIFTNHKDEIKAVLLDMVMPKMSGKQTYLELVKLEPEIKVLLVSGFKQDERVESILSMGVNGFLQKPYTLAALANEMHRIIKGE